MTEIIRETMDNLNKNGMKPYYLEKAAEVTALVVSLIGEGETVAAGGSMTVAECGVLDYLRAAGHRAPEHGNRGADVFLSGTNAITRRGELYNVDGSAGRISAIACGPKSVIIIASVNKIVDNLACAVRRVKEIAAPRNCIRLKRDTPCAKSGRCYSLSDEYIQRGDPSRPVYMTEGCSDKDRICCHYLISAYQRVPERIKVILVEEIMGF